MTYICSVGLAIPDFNISQQTVKNLVRTLFQDHARRINRLLPVFDNAAIENRQFVVDEDWFLTHHSFEEKNALYVQNAIDYSVKAVQQCLSNDHFLHEKVPFEAVDLIVFVSSTGIATPSIDARIMNKLPFRSDVIRMPLWGLGCAGGAMGLSRAYDWLKANPKQTALVICCELCSLTFQKDDMSKSNVVGTALFADGIAATLLVGDASPYQKNVKIKKPKITYTNSFTEKDSEDVMGWNVTDQGLEVIFSKSIPHLVDTIWKEHVKDTLQKLDITSDEIDSYIAHPGGKKVLEAMCQSMQLSMDKLKFSYEVLRQHGNMSSATVFYVLKK
ncbi:type III polyketide synthase [Virgibacillus soli]